MQDAGAVAGAAHAGIGNPDHIPDALLQELFGNRQHAPLRHARTTQRPGVAQHQHGVRGDVEVLAVDVLFQLRIGVKDQGWTGVALQAGIGGGGFDHGAVRAKIAPQHKGPALPGQRLIQRTDHFFLIDFSPGNVFTNGLPGDGEGLCKQQTPDALQERTQPAGVVEILHQIFPAGPQIGHQRSRQGKPVKVLQRDLRPGPPRHRQHMHDGVGRTAQSHVRDDGILKTLFRQDVLRPEILPDHFHDAASAARGHPGVFRVRRRDGGGVGQTHAQRFRDAHHGGRRAHGHAGARTAGDAVLQLRPGIAAEISRPPFVPVFPDIRAAAQSGAAPVAFGHGSGRQVDGWQIHRDGSHQQGRRGLVTAAHQHRAVQRITSQGFLHLHRHQIAVKHRGWFHEHLAQAHDRQFHRKPAGLPDPALHFLGPVAEVRMARIQIRPGIQNPDHRFPGKILRGITHLLRPRPVAEGPQIIRPEPTVRTQLLRSAAGTGE